MTPVRLVVAGVGAWGRHFARLAAGSPRVELVALVDPDPEALASAAWRSPGARPCARLDEALALAPDAVVVATPARTHRAVAAAALEAGAAVLVEKPLATSASDAEALAALAQRRRSVAMVGHLLRYHPAIERLLDEVRRGAIGRPRLLHSARRSPPGRASDVSALWALGPHDASLLLALDGGGALEALSAQARGDDEVSVQGRTGSGLSLRLELSRAHPAKERRVVVRGDEAALVFDDLRPDAPLCLHRLAPGGGLEPGGLPLPVAGVEPLAAEFEHFVGCVATGASPRTPLVDGLRVVRWLEAIEASFAAPAWMHPPGS